MIDPAQIAPLGPNDVHIWWIALDQMGADALAILDAEERARADRYRHQRDRARWIASRAALRQVLARYADTAPEKVRFTASVRWRKPTLAGSASLRFSVTHAAERAALAVAWERDVGIDLERVDAGLDLAPLLGMACTPAERERIKALPLPEQVESFLTLWTSKEAFLKATGAGLSRDPRTFAVVPLPNNRAAIQVSNPAQNPDTGPWSLRQLNPGPGWVAALAFAGTDANVSELHWPVGP